MKLNKIILPLMIALVAMLATTGCKKGFNGKTTPMPGQTGRTPGDDQPPSTISQAPPVTFDPNAVSNQNPPGGLAQNQPWTMDQVIPDPAALADQTVYFAFDSAAVLSKEESKLIIVSEKLKSDPSAKLQIEGHCDERGTEEYNRSLGERRALALREALNRAGIDGDRIRTISFGKDKPAETGHDEAAWSKNRRGVFILCHMKTGL
ncbi:MAG TPA: OmpA family protein [Candidatus Acidoferrales bacterium]|jgi:peptidoglycan-associated lipoprotein|nr:OmpA family protein [Candidatus Acidoferrales bacterium]